MIHEAGSIIISILMGEANQREATLIHTWIWFSRQSSSRVHAVNPNPRVTPPSKVKMKIQGTERKTVMNTTLKEVIYKRTSKQM